MSVASSDPLSLSRWSSDDRNSLDDLSDQELVNVVMNMEVECRRLKQENKMFIDFLKANDPGSLELLLKALAKIKDKRHGDAPKATLSIHSMISISSRRSSKFSISSLSFAMEGKGPKINLSQKTDMVTKAIEDTQAALEEFTRKTYKAKMKLKAKLEEFGLRESDLKEAKEIFEYTVVIQGYDPLTQRIPAEKFLRYMEEWLKSAQLSIQKLRLKTTSLKQVFKKVAAKLVRAKELGENVRPVDFAQLKIENKYFSDQIDDKSIHLLDLKQMNGGASLVLTNYKKHVQKQEQDHNNLKRIIEEKKKLIVDTEEECKIKKIEVDKVRENYEKIKLLRASYRVPDVIDYVKIENKLYDLKREIKVWQRRKKIQDITLNSCLRQMKNITGRSKVDPAWFKDVAVDDVMDDSDF